MKRGHGYPLAPKLVCKFRIKDNFPCRDSSHGPSSSLPGRCRLHHPGCRYKTYASGKSLLNKARIICSDLAVSDIHNVNGTVPVNKEVNTWRNQWRALEGQTVWASAARPVSAMTQIRPVALSRDSRDATIAVQQAPRIHTANVTFLGPVRKIAKSGS